MERIKISFKNSDDRFEQVTVSMLIDMLKMVSPACGAIHKGDFTIFHEDKAISLNG